MLELVVSIAIMLFVGAQVLVRVRPLDNTVSLNRAAQELGYAIRRAQAMSLAVSAVSIGGIYRIPPSIGIVVSSASGDNGHYLFFSDLYTNCLGGGIPPPDKRYDNPCERIEPDIIFPRGITIKSINGMVGISLVTVSPGYIIFKTPEATMSLTGMICPVCMVSPDPMNIVLTSSSGETRTIRIRLSGQITILNP